MARSSPAGRDVRPRCGLHRGSMHGDARSNNFAGTAPTVTSGNAPPRFSVVVPVWRGEGWIEGALRSVLSQTFDDWEVVVADNASDDDTVELARASGDERIRVETFDDQVPIFDNFNRGFARCRGAWVYLLPVADRLDPNALERTAEVIDRHAGSRPLVAVWPHARRVDPRGRPIDVRYHGAQAEAHIEGGTYDA